MIMSAAKFFARFKCDLGNSFARQTRDGRWRERIYIKSVDAHGLSSAPAGIPDLRACSTNSNLQDLQKKLRGLDPSAAKKIDMEEPATACSSD